MAEYKIVIADEHRLFLDGLERILEANQSPSYEVAAKTNSGKDLISIIRDLELDAAIFDINYVDIEPEDLIEQIRKANRRIKLFVLSAYGDMKLVKTCFRLGIDGYMLKSSDNKTLFRGLNDIFSGQIFVGENIKLSPELNGNGKLRINSTKKKMISVDRFLLRQSLTKREKEILEFINKGLSNKSISEQLFISEHTVSVHRKHIMKKLNVNSAGELLDLIDKYSILIK